MAEYAVGSGDKEYLIEGSAMLGVLLESFARLGHEVVYPTHNIRLKPGIPIYSKNFERGIEGLSRECDAGLVVAPDEILGDLTEILEENTVNLGCPSSSVRLCADKQETTRVLRGENVPVPETLTKTMEPGVKYVVKPRWGCASEGIYVTSEGGELKGGLIATRYIEGEDISASLILGKTVLPLTVNRQLIKVNKNITYLGGEVPYNTLRSKEIMGVADKTARILGCRGYVGIDMILADQPYVLDVNPRPTTSIIGISMVIDQELGDLILKARFGELPEKVNIKGTYKFTKESLKNRWVDILL